MALGDVSVCLEKLSVGKKANLTELDRQVFCDIPQSNSRLNGLSTAELVIFMKWKLTRGGRYHVNRHTRHQSVISHGLGTFRPRLIELAGANDNELVRTCSQRAFVEAAAFCAQHPHLFAVTVRSFCKLFVCCKFS